MPSDTDEFNRSTDLVLSLKDEAYEALLRPHFKQMWEERNQTVENPGTRKNSRSRATAIFDALRKRLKSTGGSFYRGRNPHLKGDAFHDKSNLVLVEDENEVMRSES